MVKKHVKGTKVQGSKLCVCSVVKTVLNIT